MTVELLSIEHRHGTDHYVCASEDVATRELDNYVQQWWEQELPDKPMPEDPNQRIVRYFDAMGDCSQPEYYNIERLEVLE